jgi:hypothetical protein
MSAVRDFEMASWRVGAREFAFMATLLTSPANQQAFVALLEKNLQQVYHREKSGNI